jgi:hypothetical protein
MYFVIQAGGPDVDETGPAQQLETGPHHCQAPALAMIRSRFSGCMNAGNGREPVIAE